MKSFRTKKWLKGLMLAMLLIVGSTVFSASAKEVQAATAGFKTIDGKTYYIKSDGSKQKGWLTLGGYKYYFNTKTGVGKGLDEGQWQIYLLFYKRQGCYGNRLDDRFQRP